MDGGNVARLCYPDLRQVQKFPESMSDRPSYQFDSIDLLTLQRFAQSIAKRSPDQLVIGLSGTLGAGKTTFVQHLAASIGIDRGDVTSPTFTLLQSHRGASPSGKIDLHHLDAYRIGDLDAWDELGIDELMERAGSWTVIEWARKVAVALPKKTLWIEIQLQSNVLRRLVVCGGPPGLVDQLVTAADEWLGHSDYCRIETGKQD